MFAFSSYRRVHLPHLELQWAQWMPLAFWAWHRLLDTGRMRDGLLCAGAVLLQLLSSLYYAVFLAIGLAVVGAVTLVARRGRLAGAGAASACARGAVVAAGVAAAYARPYAYARARVGDAIARGDEPLQRHAGELPHRVAGQRRLSRRPAARRRGGDRAVPGHHAGGAGGRRAGAADDGRPRSPTALSLGVAGDMALGTERPDLPAAARARVGALRALRAPARFGILVQLTLGVLAAMGLARAARALAADRPDAGRGRRRVW